MLLYFLKVIDEIVASMPPLILYFRRGKKKSSLVSQNIE